MPVAVHITPREVSTQHDDRDREDQAWEPRQFDAHGDSPFAAIRDAGVDAGTVQVHPLRSPNRD
jgi:hypothetical protein